MRAAAGGGGGARRVVARLLRRKAALAGALVFLVVVVAALAAPWLAPNDPYAIRIVQRLKPPGYVNGAGLTYWLGTDALGRGRRGSPPATAPSRARGQAPRHRRAARSAATRSR